jgi:TonB family protein
VRKVSSGRHLNALLVVALLSDTASSSSKPTPTPDTAALIRAYEAAHPGVLRTGGAVSEPREVVHVKPVFPEAARAKRRVLSPIIAIAVITEAGAVVDAAIVSSAHPDLNPSVLAAMRQCRYEPALNNGKPVAVFFTVTILLHPAP